MSDFVWKNEHGEIPVFSGVTGELLRYIKPLSDDVIYYIECPAEDVAEGHSIGTWSIED